MIYYLQAVQYIQEIKSKRNGRPEVQVLDESDTPDNVSGFMTQRIGFNLEQCSYDNIVNLSYSQSKVLIIKVKNKG